MTEDHVRFSGTLNSRDIYNAARPQFIRITLVFLGALLAIQFIFPSRTSNFQTQAVIYIVSLIFISLMYLFLKWSIRRSIRTTPLFQHPIRGEIRPTGVQWQVGDMMNSDLPWALIPRSRVTSSAATFNIGPGSKLIVPRRFVQSDDEWRRLASLIEKYALRP